MIFPKIGGGGGFIGKVRERGGSSSILICASSTFFLSFSDFWSDFHMPVWRPFRAPFSLDFVCIEIFGCLLSNGSGLIQFEAIFVQILL